MNLQTKDFSDLTAAELEAWRSLLDSQPNLANPFLHPAFVRVAEQALGPAQVVVGYRDKSPQLFLPFQRVGAAAVPVAEGLNEQQAVIAAPHDAVTGSMLCRAANCSSIKFDHLLGEQAEPLGLCTSLEGGSPQADLSNGFKAYAEARKAAGSSTIRETLRKERKLTREHGELTFQLHDADNDAFNALVDWKQAQHLRTGVVDLFADPNIVRFLHQVRLVDEEGLQARMSVLRLDGRPIAVHLGLFSARVGHVWYPAYDQEFSGYSPGLILLLKLMQDMAAAGIRTLDFGPGPQRYKQSLKTHDRPVCIGVIDRHRFAGAARQTVLRVKAIAKRFHVGGLRRVAASVLFPLRKANSHA